MSTEVTITELWDIAALAAPETPDVRPPVEDRAEKLADARSLLDQLRADGIIP
jgi:hypothetical protein